jgi:hypothetical protein
MRLCTQFLPFALLFALMCVAGADPVLYTVDREQSVFAVVTHKAGVAARLAHNHLIIAKTYTCEIRGETDSVEKYSFSLTFPATALEPDVPEAQTRWFPEIKKAGILAETFSEVSESDRATIKEHMLAKGQLDAEQYPEIKAELVSIQSISSNPSIKPTVGEKTFEHAATIRLTVHGKTVERAIPANVAVDNGVLFVEAVGQFRFTEFGIKPYSAFLGTVKNKDEFHVYVQIQAKAEPVI